MTRKLTTLITASALTLSGIVYLEAKEPGSDCHGPGPGAMHHMMGNPLEHLSDKLNLTADQKTKVQPIIDQSRPQLAAIHQEAMEKMRTILESAGAQIRPLLTAQQQEKFDAMKQAHQEMRKAMQDAKQSDPNNAGPGPGPGMMHHMMGNPLEHLSEKLDLTPDQKAKVKPIVDQTRPQVEALHKEAMDKARTILENAGAQIRPLLTAQQQEKFDAMKQAHQQMRKAMEAMHDAENK